MTLAPERSGAPAPVDLVTLTIDGVEVSVPKGTLIIRAAELIGTEVPRFCDHPLLDPIGACRQCIVEVEGQRKPLTACTSTVAQDMVVHTQLSSKVAEKAQAGTLELLLINHPLDCPICDKGGECPLQNQAMRNGNAESRFRDVKRTYPKPLAISSQVLLDRERCVLCARCTRFSEQIAGDPFIELFERGALEQVAVDSDQPFESYFSGNTVQICPVGALTGASYRFRARPFDLVSTPSACEHCASGCSLRADHRRGRVTRRLAGDEPEVNEEWNCDKGRWAFSYATQPDRITRPLVRDDDSGELVETSWSEALEYAARGLAECRGRNGVGVLAGGRLPLEDAYAYAKFARVALGTNDVDFRARPHSAEEEAFLGALVAGSGLGATYADLEAAPVVVTAGFEPEEESPIVFLRLRKAARRHGMRFFSIAPLLTPSVTKTSGTLVPARPGEEAGILAELAGARGGDTVVGAALRESGAVLLVGERLAEVPGGLTAAARVAEATGAKLAWVPRRAGERGAVEAGLLPSLLPGGRPVGVEAARRELAAEWHLEDLPTGAGRDTAAIVAAAGAGELDGLVVGGVDPVDLPDPAAALDALAKVPFLVSLELRESAVTELADVVLPVAAASERSGTFLDWEGRRRPFERALETPALPDVRVLHMLADELDAPLALPDTAAAARELAALGVAAGHLATGPSVEPATVPEPAAGEALLASWHWLLDEGRLQDGEPNLAGTRKRPRLHLSAATAAEIGAADGELVTVSTDRGAVTLPLVVADLPDRVVWVPTNSPGAHVRADLADRSGVVVALARSGPAPAAEPPAGDTADRAQDSERGADLPGGVR